MDPSALDIRPATSDDDLRAVVTAMALLDAGPGSIEDLDPGPGSIDGLRSLRSTMRQVVHFVAWANGKPVGFGFAGTWPGGESYLPEALIGVGPRYRRRGIGSALFRTLSDHARALGKTGFQFEVSDDRADALAFLFNRGYTEVGRELQYGLDLTSPPPPPPSETPAGVEIVTRAQRPDLVPGMYEVAMDAAPDIPGSGGEGPGRFEDWHAFEIERPNHLPETCFIAVHEDEAVGYATLQMFEGNTAYHGGTLVKRAWRRRGIARALTLRQIEAARAAGFQRLRCETEARNEPMRRLLERLEYGSLPSVIMLQGPLAS
jgi:GNAT superfamily N-acetyltransferase